MSNIVLQRETDFKICISTLILGVVHLTHEYKNSCKLGRAISIGTKILLKNHSRNLLISKRLQSLRHGHYTVTKHITNTTHEIQRDETQQKRVVHRNNIVEYFPKEKEIQPLIANYTTVYDEP